ncbi:hypothetical protein Tco_1070670 [Tanacetum coccineum]|uniref:Uncharacterized protein n=1 Tax=Tanacetum coccineum TaxID=301880 RepID=A0ABQ5HM37_9ASTR
MTITVAVFTNEWGLASLEYSQEIEGPYCTKLTTPDDIRRLLELERVMEELIRENVFGLGGHLDHLPACLPHMLYCVVAEEQYNLAYFFVKRIECSRANLTANLSIWHVLDSCIIDTSLEAYLISSNGIYNIVDRVMRPLALKQPRRPQSDRGKARHSISSSSSHHQGRSSHQHDDDDDNVETSQASTPSPNTYFNSLNPQDYQNYEIPSSSQQTNETLFARQTTLLNQTQQMHEEMRGGFKSFGKALKGCLARRKSEDNGEKYAVPTGRVVVPTGRYVVPAGKVIIIVSTGRLSLVPTGIVLSPGSDNDSDDASVYSEATIPQQQQNIQPQIITTVSNNNAKTGRDHDRRVIILPPTTADEHIAVQRESKARTTLLHQASFSGKGESKKMRKFMLKQEFSEFGISEAEGLHKGYYRMQKILSQLNQLKAKPEDEDINLSPSHSAFVSTTSASKKMSYADSPNYSSSNYNAPSNSATTGLTDQYISLEQKGGRRLILNKKETSRLQQEEGQMLPSLQEIHEIGKKEEDSKALITVDTLVDWTEHDAQSDGVIAPKVFGMIAGCDTEDAIEEGAVKMYNLITGADTKEASTAGDAGEFALMGVTSEVHNCPFGYDNKYNELQKQHNELNE